MTQDLSALSASQVSAVLDNAPVAVYVSALDTFELLYANRLAAERALCDLKPGLTCYEAVGRSAPCPFCSLEKMDRTELLVRSFQHSRTGRRYQLSGKFIDWDGRPAHIEYILDVTEARKEEQQSQAIRAALFDTFSSIPSGLCVYRFDGGRISPLFHNPAFFEIMGYDQAHIRSVEQETAFLGVHPEDLALLQEKLREAAAAGGVLQHTYRVWNDRSRAYRWIRLDGSVKSQEDGAKLLYGVYSDVTEELRTKQELTEANEKMQDVINSIPGGVAIYKVSDIFETVYFSDGLPELSGYTLEEYRELAKRDAVEMTYWEDSDMVAARAREVIRTHQLATFEFRKQHRDGHLVWVRAQVKWIGEEDGAALLHCIFHNISDFKEAQLEMNHLVNSIPGGIASYQVENGRFLPSFFSSGVSRLCGYTPEEFWELVREDALLIIYEADRPRVLSATLAALRSGEVLDISYRARHKSGKLVWIHLNGRRMDPQAESPRFYAALTGMSAEARLFQSIANETADSIYVIDRKNYELLYVSEPKTAFSEGGGRIGQKCYAALYGKDAPCAFCTLKTHAPDGEEHEMHAAGTGRYYSTRFRETDWNGIPAYVKYVQDVTEKVQAHREKLRLEQYFQTLVKNLPGGVAVIRYEPDGSMAPEFLSDGFADMTGMTPEDAWELYRLDALSGVYPDDHDRVAAEMAAFMASGKSRCEQVYRLKQGGGGYFWVKNTLSIIQSTDGVIRLYAWIHDISKELEEKEELRRQYNELILQHYRTSDPNALIVGHCNVTRNCILEAVDQTGADLMQAYGFDRETFFTRIAGLVVDAPDRKAFLNTFLNAPVAAAYASGQTELAQTSFIQLPHESRGRYAQFSVHLVLDPDTGDLTGILSVTDVTEQTLSDRVLHQLSMSGNDLVVDIDLPGDAYTILYGSGPGRDVPGLSGSHSQRVASVLSQLILPGDREHTARMLDPDYMLDRLRREGPYSFSFSIPGRQGDVRVKSLTVSAIDLRLGRVCLARTDITGSVREQQGLLNVIAYTFELMAFISVDAQRLTLYTRQTILENLPPLTKDCGSLEGDLSAFFVPGADRSAPEFLLKNILRRLEEAPTGYDFVLPRQEAEGLSYKQINVLWGDRSRKRVCIVQADVTDMLAEERRRKDALEAALAQAEEASRAKSDFLSSMSHDIRTPMNAIMGMTALAAAHLEDRGRVEDCLQKIALSSRHLLSLINDILDMNKIERSKITLNRARIDLFDLVEQVTSIMAPQAKAAGLAFTVRTGGVSRRAFYGDPLRINQILINILGNAVKFTGEGGTVAFTVEELPETAGRVRYRFTVQDTGVGMSEDFLAHLFEPFTRSRGMSRVEGSGLGLSITKGLVDLMGGRISVESRPGEGSTFRVELSCEAAPDCAASRETRPAPGKSCLAGRRFLVAEDNAINAEIICELLRMYGGETALRTDGAQAALAFRDAPPGTYDAVLMDIQMPNMNGYEAARAIRALDRADAGTIPIVAMTANAFSEDIQTALEAGMNAHVSKPIDVDLLLSTLCGLLDGGPQP